MAGRAGRVAGGGLRGARGQPAAAHGARRARGLRLRRPARAAAALAGPRPTPLGHRTPDTGHVALVKVTPRSPLTFNFVICIDTTCCYKAI